MAMYLPISPYISLYLPRSPCTEKECMAASGGGAGMLMRSDDASALSRRRASEQAGRGSPAELSTCGSSSHMSGSGAARVG